MRRQCLYDVGDGSGLDPSTPWGAPANVKPVCSANDRRVLNGLRDPWLLPVQLHWPEMIRE